MSSLTATTDTSASRRVEKILTILLPVIVTGFALAVGLGLVVATGASVPDTISAFWTGAFGSSYAIGASLNRAVPFALVGLGFILAARANLTNVGGEGQIAVFGAVEAEVFGHQHALDHVQGVEGDQHVVFFRLGGVHGTSGQGVMALAERRRR